MPFHDSIYYPYSGDTQGTHSSAGIPSLLNSPLSQPSSNGAVPGRAMTPPGAPTALPPFRFRPRRENVDWRRIGALDVDRLVTELDVDALQEHLNAVTFCSVEGERCQRCQSPVDPVLVKLFRLAQLTVEWLLHCQGFLTVNLRAAEERLAAAGRDREQLLLQQKKHEEKVEALTTELKQRKKIIRNQQSMFAPRLVTSQKCPYCDKAFINPSFLQSHMQRRHPDEYENYSRLDSERKSLIDSYKQEISSLKEQLIQEQKLVQAKKAQETDQQSLLRDIKREVDRFLAEDMVRVDRKIEDSCGGIRREMELFNKNLQELSQIQVARQDAVPSPVQRRAERDVESKEAQAVHKLRQQLKKQDKLWESKLEGVKAQYDSEKNQTENHIHRLRQEMDRRLLEKDDAILALREQINRMSSNPSPKVVEVPVIITAPAPAPEPKPKKVQLDSSSISEKRPVERKPEPRPEPRLEPRPEPKRQPEKQPVFVSSLRRDPTLKREQLAIMRQTLADRLEQLGLTPGRKGVTDKEYKAIKARITVERETRAREQPDFWRYHEELSRVVKQRVKERMKDGDLPQETRTQARPSAQVTQTKPGAASLPFRVTQVVSRPLAQQAKTPQPAPRSRTSTPPKTSTPNAKTTPKTSTPRTPPFSSDEDSDEEETDDDDDEEEAEPPKRVPPQHRPTQAAPGQTRANQNQPAKPQQTKGQGNSAPWTVVDELDSEDDWSDVSEMQEIDPKQFHGYKDQNGSANKKGSVVSALSKQLDKQVAERAAKRPAGGVSVLPESKDTVQELTYTDLEESSEWLVSSLEEKPSRGPGALKRSQDSSTSVWGSSTGNQQKPGLTAAGTSNTVGSSLASLTDSSDSDDI